MLNPPLLLGAFVLLAATYLTDASSNLFVASPNLLRVNSDEDVWVTLHHDQNTQATVKVYLENYPDRGGRFSEKTITVGKDESKKVTMRVGWDNIPQGSQQTYVYLVAECQTLGFKKESVILLSKKSGYLFLQTDKPIYNPHEKVNIRVVSLDAEMKPSDLEITLDVINPNGDVIKRYLKQQATNGFVNVEFNLPKILVYGNWTLQASYKDRKQPETTKTSIEFEVKEYVLPTFSTKVKTLDDFILESQSEIQYKITTNYVFGTPVTGRGKVYYYLVYPGGNEHQIGTLEFDVTGDYVGSIKKGELGNRWFPEEGTRFLIKVAVTEGATGKQEKASDSSAVFVKSPYVISYERMPKFFRPHLPFTVKVDLTYPNKAVAAGIPISIEALVTVGGRQLGAHGNQVTTKDYVTEENGRQDVTLDIPDNAADLKIKVTTHDPDLAVLHQAEKPILLAKHTSGSNEFMVLQRRTTGREIKINHNLEIRADFTNNRASKKVNFMVVARGKILQHFVKLVNDRTTHENIQVSPLMSPQARVIAYYFTGNEIVSDSLVLDIVKSCGNELTITTNKNEYQPKDNVEITIAAGKRSTVSVLGVDKAVYLLSEKDILTRSKMFKKMLEMDIGCGPGGGKDTADVFKQAGLSVLVQSGLIAIPRRNSEKCPQNMFRRRRNVMETYSDIMARLSDQDKVCCNRGKADSVDATRSCQQLTSQYGSSRRSCSAAYLECCVAETRRVSGGDRGRSGGDGDQVQLGSFENVQVDIREDFKETWINELINFGPNEESINMRLALPDSITTWVISGVSVSPDQGMCVAVPTNITSRKPFFVHVDLPYAAVRTEQLEVKATVYNLGERDLSRVLVSLKADKSICYAAESGKYTYRHEISVKAKSATSVYFPIVPLKANDIPSEISVKALSAFGGDEVIKKIRVVHEGLKTFSTQSVRLDPEEIMGDAGSGVRGWEVDINKAEKRQTVKIPLKFPENTIPGTEKCSVSIHGNLLGPMVPSGDFDISKRIKLPAGCGEQNMITMGPLVYATRYLLRIGKLTGALEADAYKFITKGYESQLTYKKKDGSFAVWQPARSSSWLTAFVTKVFCQASTFDQIGQKVREHVVGAVNWLFKNAQDPQSGKFVETYKVYHREMQGQTLTNELTLTAFIVECISSCKEVINLSDREFAGPMQKAVQYIERNRDTLLGNPYGQAILAYALTMTNSQYKTEANQLLWDMSSFDTVTGMRYWNLDGQAVDHSAPVWYTKPPSAAAIETASYALLTQLAISDEERYFTNSGPIASWLIRQRTKTGSFSSTTDTVLGLEALSEYAFKANSRSTLDMRIRFYASGINFGVNENLELKEASALIPILIENNLPIGDILNVEATGTGMAQLQVECTYHAPPKDDQGCPFTLEVDVTEYKATSADLGPLDAVPAQSLPDRSRFGGFRFKRADDGGTSSYVATIQSRIRYNGGQKVGMSMLEVSLFTGFEAYLDDLKKLKKIGKVDDYEITGSSVKFYLKEISNIEDTFVKFRATQKYKVGKTQPVAVKVYDYYEPNSRQCTKFYHPHAGSALLAQSCEESQGTKVCACVAGTCAEYWGFDRAHIPRGKRFKLRTRTELYQDACNIYDYVVKVKAGQRFINKPLVEMQAEIEHVIKLGRDNFDTGETINFVWNSECTYPLMEDGVSYLVMGKDGKEYIDKNNRAKTKYILNSSSHVVQWYGQERRGYMDALNAFAGKLLREGCGQ